MRPPCRALNFASGRSSGAPLPPASPQVSGSGPADRAAGLVGPWSTRGSGLRSVAPDDVETRRPHQHRDAHQRPHPRSRGPPGRPERRAGRHRAHRGRPAAGAGGRARPRRGRCPGPPAGLQAHGLRQVQVRERAEGPGVPPQPAAHGDQGAEAPAEDRHRTTTRPRSATSCASSRVATRSRSPSCSAVASSPAPSWGSGCCSGSPRTWRAGYGRGDAEAGRSQHDHGDRANEEAARPSARRPARTRREPAPPRLTRTLHCPPAPRTPGVPPVNGTVMPKNKTHSGIASASRSPAPASSCASRPACATGSR